MSAEYRGFYKRALNRLRFPHAVLNIGDMNRGHCSKFNSALMGSVTCTTSRDGFARKMAGDIVVRNILLIHKLIHRQLSEPELETALNDA
jgi:hypothetical protein